MHVAKHELALIGGERVTKQVLGLIYKLSPLSTNAVAEASTHGEKVRRDTRRDKRKW
jgi:hypothetical protein